MHFIAKPVKLYSLYKNFVSIRAMSSEFLIKDSKYSFLKDLGLSDTNSGVFDGKWKGSGPVIILFLITKNILSHLFSRLSSLFALAMEK